MKLTVKVPRAVFGNPGALVRAIDNGLDNLAELARVDFETTVETWENPPEFTIEEKPGERIVGTDNEVYGFVNNGTPPHIIVGKPGKGLAFSPGGRPKTTPGVIGSTSGSRGSGVIVRPRVNHPGTEARNFDQAIAKKYRGRLAAQVMQRAIDAAFN